MTHPSLGLNSRDSLPIDLQKVADLLLTKREEKFFGKIELHVQNGEVKRAVVSENIMLSAPNSTGLAGGEMVRQES